MGNHIEENTWVKIKRISILCITLLLLSLIFNVVQYVQTCKLNNKYNDLKKQQDQLELFAKKLNEKVDQLDSHATTMK